MKQFASRLATALLLTLFALILAQAVCLAQNPADIAASIEKTWLDVQGAPLSDRDKVQDTVYRYFLLKLEARKVTIDRIGPLDFAYLFDLASTEGRQTYRYEWGRLRYFVASGPFVGTTWVWYQFAPLFLETTVAGDTATVVVIPKHYARYKNDREPFDGVYTDHIITLIKKGDRWLIQKDIYEDEQTRMNPPGTDWDRLIREIPAELERLRRQGGIQTPQPRPLR